MSRWQSARATWSLIGKCCEPGAGARYEYNDHTFQVHDLGAKLCLCFFLAVRDYALERVVAQGDQEVPTMSSWKYGTFESKCLARVGDWLRDYCEAGPNGLWVPTGAVSWCLWELMSMALDRHRDRQTLTWHGFHLEPEEEQAVWETAFATYHGDASSLDVDVLRGVTVYVEKARG